MNDIATANNNKPWPTGTSFLAPIRKTGGNVHRFAIGLDQGGGGNRNDPPITPASVTETCDMARGRIEQLLNLAAAKLPKMVAMRTLRRLLMVDLRPEEEKAIVSGDPRWARVTWLLENIGDKTLKHAPAIVNVAWDYSWFARRRDSYQHLVPDLPIRLRVQSPYQRQGLLDSPIPMTNLLLSGSQRLQQATIATKALSHGFKVALQFLKSRAERGDQDAKVVLDFALSNAGYGYQRKRSQQAILSLALFHIVWENRHHSSDWDRKLKLGTHLKRDQVTALWTDVWRGDDSGPVENFDRIWEAAQELNSAIRAGKMSGRNRYVAMAMFWDDCKLAEPQERNFPVVYRKLRQASLALGRLRIL